MEITDYPWICSILQLASHYLLKLKFNIFIYVFISSVDVQLNTAVFALNSVLFQLLSTKKACAHTLYCVHHVAQ